MPAPPQRKFHNYELAEEEAPAEAGPPTEDPPPAPPKRRAFGFFRRKKEEPIDDGPVQYDDDHLPEAGVVLNEVSAVQKETLDAIARTERVVYETEAVGHESLQAVSKNREQIAAVDEELDRMAPMSERAKKDVGIFARRLFRDKCFMCLFFLVCCGIVAAIVSAVVYDKKIEDLPDIIFGPVNPGNETDSNSTDVVFDPY